MRSMVEGAAALSLVAASGAQAIVGGSEGSGPLARSAIMVLRAGGGMCSGIVVAPDAILTAAHCVAGGGEIRVHFRDDGQPVLIAPTARALHPGYAAGAEKTRKRSIDLALIRVPEALPARFGPATLADAAPSKADAVTVGGYGVAREGDARSTGTFRSAKLKVVEPYGPSTILVWAAGQGAGACDGDSGGMVAAAGAVVAVTSWAAGQGVRGCGSMTQGVLLGPQRAWLDRILAGWGRSATWR